jgi:hypothetical protein
MQGGAISHPLYCPFAIDVKSCSAIEDIPMSINTDAIVAIDRHIGAAQLAIICELIKALVNNGVLSQCDLIIRFENLAKDLMNRQGAEHAVPIVDIVRNLVAGEQDRLPS